MLTNPFRFFKRYVAEIHFVPAVLALLIQCGTLLVVFGLSFSISLVTTNYLSFDFRFPVFILILMQALFAALLSQLLGMAIWWRWIHLCFPFAIWAMSSLAIPNEVYLVGFLVSLSLFWTTFRSQVPFYPSRPVVWQQVAKLMPLILNRPVRMVDIGSGLGDMSMYIARHRPDSLVEGVEIAPLPWLVSFVRARINRSKATFKLGDYRHLNFAHYDVIFAYLSPAAMMALWEKSQAEMQTGSLLISYEFEIPRTQPTYSISTGEQSPKLYVWRMGKQ